MDSSMLDFPPLASTPVVAAAALGGEGNRSVGNDRPKFSINCYIILHIYKIQKKHGIKKWGIFQVWRWGELFLATDE